MAWLPLSDCTHDRAVTEPGNRNTDVRTPVSTVRDKGSHRAMDTNGPDNSVNSHGMPARWPCDRICLSSEISISGGAASIYLILVNTSISRAAASSEEEAEEMNGPAAPAPRNRTPLWGCCPPGLNGDGSDCSTESSE